MSCTEELGSRNECNSAFLQDIHAEIYIIFDDWSRWSLLSNATGDVWEVIESSIAFGMDLEWLQSIQLFELRNNDISSLSQFLQNLLSEMHISICLQKFLESNLRWKIDRRWCISLNVDDCFGHIGWIADAESQSKTGSCNFLGCSSAYECLAREILWLGQR